MSRAKNYSLIGFAVIVLALNISRSPKEIIAFMGGVAFSTTAIAGSVAELKRLKGERAIDVEVSDE